VDIGDAHGRDTGLDRDAGAATVTPDIKQAQRHASWHRDDVLRSAICGCYCCRQTFSPTEIKDWIDEWETDGSLHTALCPRCGVDAVLGNLSGFPITPEFLQAMHDYWFSVEAPIPPTQQRDQGKE
jgi:hypothetical protein